jgi:diguanylate cyclase (GGDEF)-like protein
MAASDNNPPSRPAPPGGRCLQASDLHTRLEEEISRGERHGTKLSCLLILVENLEELAREHGGDLGARTLEYIAATLPHELRRFDRIGMPSDHELLIVLPGADGPRGEIVARRVLERMRTIKIEVDGARRTLHVAVGLTAWREDDDAERLLARARTAAARPGNGEGLSAEEAHTREAGGEPSATVVSAGAAEARRADGPQLAS